MSLIIKINKSNSDFCDLKVLIDQQIVEYELDDDLIVLCIPGELCDGLHKLQVSLGKNSKRLEILDVIVGNCGSRQNIYFSYITKAETILQPATTLWEPETIWTYPFATPFSHFHSTLCKTLTGNQLGKNLYQDYDIFWPDSMDPGEQYPMLIRDFFRRDFDFTVLHKKDLSKFRRPYQQLQDFQVPDAVEKELLAGVDVLKNLGELPGQTMYNAQESSYFNQDTAWKVAYFSKTKKPNHDLCKHFPETIRWIDLLDLDPLNIWVGILDQNQYIAPHVDPKPAEHVQYHGCCLLYIPVGWTPGVWFKFAGVGMVPSQPCITNSQHFTHALINNGSATRLSLAIRSTLDKIGGRWGVTLTDA